MPLSTFNSNLHVPYVPYKKMWLVAGILCVVLLGSMEAYWRVRGFYPSVTDDKALWAYYRDQVYATQTYKKIVVIGYSRAQLGIVPEVLNSELKGYKTVHLTVDGHSPIETLEHLARDIRFNGVVLCDISLESCIEERNDATGQKEWCDYYDTYWSNYGKIEKGVNTRIKAELQERLNILSSYLMLKRQITQWNSLKPTYLETRSDRYRPAHYYTRMSEKELEDHKRMRIEKRKEDLREYTEKGFGDSTHYKYEASHRLGSAVALIQRRGGKVIFLKMPVTGETGVIEDTMYPRSQFWDTLESVTGAETIHFMDYPQLRGFICPDTSHLDVKDAKVYTFALAKIIKSIIDISVSREKVNYDS